MLKISDDFTLEDIRAMRDDFGERHKDGDWDAIAAEIKAGAAEFRRDYAAFIARKHQKD
ncbi:MAG: hypothetical protein LBL80_06285 [Ruminococcus sp.]|jgi:hypothetical protein|nr:hypothetical protein [Ruminococcus sp.]